MSEDEIFVELRLWRGSSAEQSVFVNPHLVAAVLPSENDPPACRLVIGNHTVHVAGAQREVLAMLESRQVIDITREEVRRGG